MNYNLSIKGMPECKALMTNASNNASKASREYVQKMGTIAKTEEKKELLVTRNIWTRALYDSMSVKIPRVRDLGYYTAVSGASKSTRQFIRIRQRGAKAGKTLVAIPANYAHLVEAGTVERYTKTGAYRGKMPASKFTEHAYATVVTLYKLKASQVFKKYLNG